MHRIKQSRLFAIAILFDVIHPKLLDLLLFPVWVRVRSRQEKEFFHDLIDVTGDCRLFSVLCCSYIRFSRQKGVTA